MYNMHDMMYSISNSKNLQYRKMLSDIARRLNYEDIKHIRFICKAVNGLTKRDLELEDPLDFFVKLEERGVLSCEDTDFLRELLEMIHRADCVQLLKQYETYELGLSNGSSVGKCVQGSGSNEYYGARVPCDYADGVCDRTLNQHTFQRDEPLPALNMKGPVRQVTENSWGEDLSDAFDIVVEEIGRDWRQLARKLLLTETEIEHITNDHMRNLREQSMQCLLLWKKKMRTKATKTALIEALNKCKMMYISDRLEGSQFR